jgi:hypothetical protein
MANAALSLALQLRNKWPLLRESNIYYAVLPVCCAYQDTGHLLAHGWMDKEEMVG